MTEPAKLDNVRASALARIDQAERLYRLGIALVALFEAVFLLAFLFLMDFRERLHWLILLASLLAYGVALIAVVNLGHYVKSSTHAILQAILTRNESTTDSPGPL